MNNEPVAWLVDNQAYTIKEAAESLSRILESPAIPLYTHPVKYCPSENNEAYEKGFIDGMAKQRDSAVQRMVEANIHPVKELTDEEIIEIVKDHFIGAIKLGIVLTNDNVLEFAREILRKAQEK